MDAETLGRRWLDARLASGRSAQDVADELKINRNNIYRLEKGANDVTLRLMQRVATAYGTNLGVIFAEEEAIQQTPREFWPLLDVLQPLTPDQRERLISNVVSNLRFAAAIYGTTASTKSVTESARSDEFLPALNERRVSSTASAVHLTRVLQGEVDAPFDEANEDATTRSAGPGAAQASRTANRKR